MRTTTLDLLAIASCHEPHPIAERIAWWVRRKPAKVVAREFGVDYRTVENWRAGHLPQMRHLIAMAEKWGLAFLEDVFAPVLAQSDLALSRRLERLEHDIASLRRELDHAPAQATDRPAPGPLAHGAGRVALPQGQAPSRARPTLRERAARIVASALVAALLLGHTDGSMVRPGRPSPTRPVVTRVLRDAA